MTHRGRLNAAAFPHAARWLAIVAACLFFAPARGAESRATTAEREIVALLTAQAEAWNRGDIPGFMQGYAQTDDLRFASGGDVTYGWRATLERYQKRYTDRQAMGTLTFTDIVVTPLAPDAALAFGRWKLTREKDTPQGLFTLTLRKTATGWRIIQDHTSSAAP